jgi:hypothetical protein
MVTAVVMMVVVVVESRFDVCQLTNVGEPRRSKESTRS